MLVYFLMFYLKINTSDASLDNLCMQYSKVLNGEIRDYFVQRDYFLWKGLAQKQINIKIQAYPIMIEHSASSQQMCGWS